MKREVAFIFPGQGAQYVGMGQELAANFPVVAATLAEADELLQEPLCELIFSGPASRLEETYYTQPAILAVSVAIARLAAQLVKPVAVAGHSLGEYAALVAAEVLPFAEALRIVRLRGRYMEEAVPAGTGTMCAILGLDRGKVEEICAAVGGEGVAEPATYNGGRQVVIAGTCEGVAWAGQMALDAGARRVIPLQVSGPFHSTLLRPAGERLRQVLACAPLETGQVPIYCNAHAKAVQTPAEIKEALVQQMSAPVRWEETILAMRAAGIQTFVELGPGRVLSGLVRRIDSQAEIFNVEDMASWGKFVAWAKGNGVR